MRRYEIFIRNINGLIRETGGEGGIRTLGTHKGTTVFETAPIDRSGTSPRLDGGLIRTLAVYRNLLTQLPATITAISSASRPTASFIAATNPATPAARGSTAMVNVLATIPRRVTETCPTNMTEPFIA